MHPQVFLDIKNQDRNVQSGQDHGEIELFADIVPKTATNFLALCTGEEGTGTQGKPLRLNVRIIPDFMAQSGDFKKSSGTGGESIYGCKFKDENFMAKHDKPYMLSKLRTRYQLSQFSKDKRTPAVVPKLSRGATCLHHACRGRPKHRYLNIRTVNGSISLKTLPISSIYAIYVFISISIYI